MSDNICNPHPLILAALEARDKLELTGDNEELLKKFNGLLNGRVTWHGGEQAQLRALLAKVTK